MTEPKYFAIPSDEKIQTAIDGYAPAVGRLSGAWNYLHQTLGGLFAVIIGGDHELLLTAWRPIESDRSQREMLRAVIAGASLKRSERTPKAPADLLWVLKRADALSDVRNDAIRALVGLYFVEADNVEINVALPARGKRERKLLARAAEGRKLLDEFANCGQDTNQVPIFVRRATFALADPERQEWPTPRLDPTNPDARRLPHHQGQRRVQEGLTSDRNAARHSGLASDRDAVPDEVSNWAESTLNHGRRLRGQFRLLRPRSRP